jgi:hypothetical protein
VSMAHTHARLSERVRLPKITPGEACQEESAEPRGGDKAGILRPELSEVASQVGRVSCMAAGRAKQARVRVATRRESRVRDEGCKAAEAPLAASAVFECRTMRRHSGLTWLFFWTLASFSQAWVPLRPLPEASRWKS